MTSLLTLLPNDLIVTVLIEWLPDAKSFVHFDSALCSKVLRAKYLSCFSTFHQNFNKTMRFGSQKQLKRYLTWVKARAFNFSSNITLAFDITENFIWSQLTNINDLTIQSLSKVHIQDVTSNLSQLVALRCDRCDVLVRNITKKKRNSVLEPICDLKEVVISNELAPMNVDALKWLMRTCPKLEKLELVYGSHDENFIDFLASFLPTMKHLTELIIHRKVSSSDGVCTTSLHGLKCPLHSLTLLGFNPNELITILSICSSPALKELKIAMYDHITEEEMHTLTNHCIPHWTTLQSLVIERDYCQGVMMDSNESFRLTALMNGITQYCPQLHTLQAPEEWLDDDCLVSLSRSVFTSTLQILRLGAGYDGLAYEPTLSRVGFDALAFMSIPFPLTQLETSCPDGCQRSLIRFFQAHAMTIQSIHIALAQSIPLCELNLSAIHFPVLQTLSIFPFIEADSEMEYDDEEDDVQAMMPYLSWRLHCPELHTVTLSNLPPNGAIIGAIAAMCAVMLPKLQRLNLTSDYDWNKHCRLSIDAKQFQQYILAYAPTIDEEA